MALTRVVFVCIGNSCRSQMAEGFARTYGPDVIVPRSAGLGPALIVAPLTHKTMQKKNIALVNAFPKGLDAVPSDECDLIVNMSGHKLPVSTLVPVQEWNVRDPIGESEEVYGKVADQIEQLVMRLILNLRAQASAKVTRTANGI